ncbi:MAG: chemotaxis protein CheW [Zoogloea sp.]|uniref:chemotaxis protein CheW n=1 Tax=Zoogloea sp. TaxID=49181 RepID=UPI003F2F3304
MRKKAKFNTKAELSYLVRFMGALFPDQKRLSEIQAVYDNLTLLGQLLGAGTDITGMRRDFNQLAAVLLDQLAKEHYKKATMNLGSCARVAIDILTRNLFERTADIGFLATDSEVCGFAEAVEQDPAVRDDVGWKIRIHRHFAEYVAKYSVYHNIILLSPSGEVLAQLDENNPVSVSTDRVLGEALTTEAGYVEVVRPIDLLPNEPTPLVYAYRVMSADGTHPVGVLCLCFRFKDECQRIFKSLVSEDDWTVVTLIDPAGRIVASSDIYQFPVGARVEPVPENECRIMRFAGREYLATTRPANPYQGYEGPGWLGHVMAPLNHAFEMAEAQELEGIAPDFLDGVLDVATLFGQTLRDIPVQATTIQQELNRAVWNGNIWLARDSNVHNSEFAKVLLREIGSTGIRTRNVFSESTNSLYKTVVSSVLFDCGTQAALAIDIMDRNLYERANDCRWWALTRAFREELAQTSADDPARRVRLTEILRQLNQLYTVYSNLILFDHAGKVVAVSNPAYNDCLGKTLGDDWVRPTLGLRGPQQYSVSDFSASEFYAGKPTYIYSASIRALDSDDPVGGIAVVFDSALQFQAMLRDALPRQEDGSLVPGAFAVYAETDGKVIASTAAGLSPGQSLGLEPRFFSLQKGETTADIVAYDGRYYAVGSCKSEGYREYKGEGDSYQKEVVALIFTPLSETLADVRHQRAALPAPDDYLRHGSGKIDTQDVASFYIGQNWYGLNPSSVVAAVDAEKLTPMPGAPEWVAGCLMFEDSAVTVMDISSVLAPSRPEGERRRGRETYGYKKQILILQSRSQGLRFGLTVDTLGEIAEIEKSRIEALPGMMADGLSMIDSLIKPRMDDQERRILVVLSVEKILRRFAVPGQNLCEAAEEMRTSLEHLVPLDRSGLSVIRA